jgi:membrane-bound serine protease (ClpP class)
VATEEIYMAPESVIGAAAPIMMSPGGTGVQEMPSTMEVKMTSALSAKIRAYAQKYGHNTEVVNAMINKQTELILDGKTLNEKGQILTLTNREAEEPYGDPPKPLLSAGTVESLEALIAQVGDSGAEVTRIEPTGAERLATWLTALNWLWLIVGVAGIYLEIKTPGFGLPGIAGICGFALYFLGSYVAGLAGIEWAALFMLGLILVALEIFVWPGTVVSGLVGLALILVSLVMAFVDMYPGMPAVPTLPQLRVPLRDLGIAALGSMVVVVLLARLLPRTPLYAILVSQSASGVASVHRREETADSRVGLEGTALSPLRPGGKAQFGEDILDVTTQGEMIDQGAAVRIIRHRMGDAVVEELRRG